MATDAGSFVSGILVPLFCGLMVTTVLIASAFRFIARAVGRAT
jgi:hypothetical protein